MSVSRRTALSCMLVSALMLSGCPENGSGTGPDGTGPDAGSDGGSDGINSTDPFTSATAICDGFPAAYCAWASRCGTMQSEASCLASLSQLGLDLSDGCQSSLAAGVHDGRQTLNPSFAQACLQAVRTVAACDGQDATEGVAECQAATTGTVAVGGACYTEEDCQPGNACVTDTCPGLCQAKKPAGTAASASDECQDGLYVYAGACRTPVAANASCAPIAPTVNFQRCTEDAFCDSVNRTCKAKFGSGVSCNRDEQCGAGLSCNGGACSSLAGLGQPCRYGQGAIGCKMDLVCSVSTFPEGTCEARQTSGAPCVFDLECEAALYCAGEKFVPSVAKGSCQPRVGPSSACEDDNCQAAYYCDLTCQPKKGLDASCTATGQCADGLSCEGDKCVTSACKDSTP